jgi:hypothetical protein
VAMGRGDRSAVEEEEEERSFIKDFVNPNRTSLRVAIESVIPATSQRHYTPVTVTNVTDLRLECGRARWRRAG